ncbi:MAG: class I SAM-dependent methyltransferase [Croceibacterium sp.]
MTDNASAQRLERSSGCDIFGDDAAGYHAGRIGYPDELYDAVLGRVKAHPDILEIGAGTGLATEALLARSPQSMTVVEPSHKLIAFMSERLHGPGLQFIAGPFPDVKITGHYDLAVCAAAFHWLDPQAALARVKALLRPGGVWAMWWNSYRNAGIGDRLSDAVVPLLEGIALPPSEGPTGHYSLDTALHKKTLEDAGFGAVAHHVFRRERQLSVAEAVALYRSYSFIRLLPDKRRSEFLGNLAALVEDEFGGSAPNIVLTVGYSAQLGA